MKHWKYTVQTSTLLSDRTSSACALIKDKNGNNLAIISSGVSSGRGNKLNYLLMKLKFK